MNPDGRFLEDRTTSPASGLGISDNALRWHFEQAVLANMKGTAGEETWDYDLEEGDEIGQILDGPHAGERMEAELFARLSAGDQVSHPPG